MAPLRESVLLVESNIVWEGPEAQDMIAFYNAIIEVAYVLLTSKHGCIQPVKVSTPAFSLHALETNAQWAHLGEETVGLCLEGFLLFAEIQLVDLWGFL